MTRPGTSSGRDRTSTRRRCDAHPDRSGSRPLTSARGAAPGKEITSRAPAECAWRWSAIGLSTAPTAGLAARAVAGSHRVPPSVLLSHSKCAGHERWKIKTLSDDEADQVNKTARTTTVDELRENDTRPDKVSAKVGRIARVEFRRYRVRITLHQAFREDDGDLHVIIHDPHHDGEADPAHR
jgi:hypothetical protein